MYYVYFLRSLKKNRYYIGLTTTLQLRLGQHNKGETPSTKPYRPWVLMHEEHYSLKRDATKREWYLKHSKGYLEKKRIIEQYKQHTGGVA